MRPPPTPRIVAVAVLTTLASVPPGAARGQATVLPGSLTLAEAVEATLTSHPVPRSATARVDEAEAMASSARASRLPSLRLEADLTRFQEPMIVAPLHSLDLSRPPRFDETLVQGRLGLAYTLFDGGARSARIHGAEASAGAAWRGKRAAEAALLEAVATAYVGLRSARAVRTAAEAQVDAVQEELERARRQVQAGTAPRVEALRAEAALQDARAELAAADATAGLATRNLARLMGADPESVAAQALAEVDLPDLAPPGREVRNPEVDRARQQMEAAEAAVAVERGDAWPRLDARAGVVDYGTLRGDHVFEWQAGLQLSWSLFTGGARRASLDRAEARLRAARAELEEAELDAARAVDAARAAVVEADARAEALEASRAQWTEVARIETLALEAGSGVQADLLRAEARRFQAGAGLARARSDAVLARVSLARAQGVLDGPWLNRSPESRP